MNESTQKAVFKGKLEKINQQLDWIIENCSQTQIQRVSEAFNNSFNDSNVTVNGVEEMSRVSHEVRGISPPPTKEEVKYQSSDNNYAMLSQEIVERKKIIKGLKVEIEELQQLKKQA
jgi:hypothetical protein